MFFNSLHFIFFFPIVFCVYVLLPARVRYLWLLAASYYFYMCWNPKYVVLLLFTTLTTYAAGILVRRIRSPRPVLAAAVIANLLLLFVFKYLNFAIGEINKVISIFRVEHRFSTVDLILPVGISFFVFQAIGYVIDVYRGKVEPEKNVFRYALFVSFFPQLVAGPIERSFNLLHQLREVPEMPRRKLLNPKRIWGGFVLIVWGLFVKLVIADRIAIFVDKVFDRYNAYGSVILILAAFGFSMQLYCDFHSYSTIALGAAKILGIKLMENFKAPFLATSSALLWRNWHISLSSWFRDYVYIPLGGSRKGKARRFINQLITMLISGLWHGANWSFVVWGGLNGFYIAVEGLLRPYYEKVRDKIGVRTETFGYRFLCILCTNLLFMTTAVFFRANSMTDAFRYYKGIVTRPDFHTLLSGAFLENILEPFELLILLGAMTVLLLVDSIKVRRQLRIDQWLREQTAVFQILFVLFLIAVFLIYGIYGPGFDAKQFIYFQF